MASRAATPATQMLKWAHLRLGPRGGTPGESSLGTGRGPFPGGDEGVGKSWLSQSALLYAFIPVALDLVHPDSGLRLQEGESRQGSHCPTEGGVSEDSCVWAGEVGLEPESILSPWTCTRVPGGFVACFRFPKNHCFTWLTSKLTRLI